MGTNKSWVKLWRSFDQWEWYQDRDMMQMWIHILIHVNDKTTDWKGRKIPAGSMVVGRKKLAMILDTTEQKVRTCLNRLQDSGEIIATSTNKFTVISVVGWAKYQNKAEKLTNKQPTNNQPTTNQQPTNNQPLTTSKEINNNTINSIIINKNKRTTETFVPDACYFLFNEILDLFDEKFKPSDDEQKMKWLVELEKINRLDGYAWDEIKNTIVWARKNKFWRANFLSCAAIRKKGSNGATKFQNMNQQFKREQQNENKTDRTSIQKDPSGGKKRTIDDFRSTTTPPQRTIDDFKPKK